MNRLAWTDRWASPTLEELLEPLKPHHRQCFELIRSEIDKLGGIEQRLGWYGPSWRWAIEYHITDESGNIVEPLCYVVANPELPQICVSLRSHVLTKLPMKRLNRFIRDGINTAKCSVKVNWVSWTPASTNESSHLVDLLRRKRLLTLNHPDDTDE